MKKSSNKTYREAEAYLNSLQSFTRKHPPAQIKTYLAPLSIKEASFVIFHIAGTNGKGSTASFLESILRAAGEKVGTFTSPHLQTTRERIRVDGKMIPEASFAEAFSEVLEICPKEEALHPTYFEFLFLMALRIFTKEQVSIVILEAGLGGDKDVTNLISSPAVSVITSIGIDHAAFLGDTISSIATEKAGIIKSGCPLVYAANNPEASTIFENRAKELGAEVFPIEKSSYVITGQTEEHLFLDGLLLNGEKISLSAQVKASYQAENIMLAVRAAEVFGIQDPFFFQEGIGTAFWPGRMEEISPGILVDGAHNPAAARGLLAALSKRRESGFLKGNVTLLFATAPDKDYKTVADLFVESGLFSKVVLTKLPGERSLSVEKTREAFATFSGQIVIVEDTEKIASYLRSERSADETVIVAGSLYLVGILKEQFQKGDSFLC